MRVESGQFVEAPRCGCVGIAAGKSARDAQKLSARLLCDLRPASGAKQLQQVGSRAHQLPFATNILVPPQAEAPEAAPLFDLSKDGSMIALRISESAMIDQRIWIRQSV